MKLDYLDDITFYSTESSSNNIFAEYVIPPINDTTCEIKRISHIDSVDFRYFLEYIVIPELKDYAVKDIINDVKAFCNLYGNEDIVYPKTRTGGKLKDGLVEYALYDNSQKYIAVTENGWKITKKTHHKFLGSSENGKQIIPLKSDTPLLKLLDKYINSDDDSKIIFITWLVQAFCEGNHSALLIMADRGSGKSTLTKMIRRVIDPAQINPTAFPNKTDGLLTTLTNSYLVTFDNTSEISKTASDILCISVTGGTCNRRELYTTNKMSVFNLHNTIVINGINILPTESDFAERCIMLNLNKISSKKRITDSSIMDDFKKDLPYILGGIFDTLSKAMKVINTLKPDKLPRMAEPYLDMLAIAVALGVKENDFERIYFDNLKKIDKARSNTDIVYAVKEYMTKHVKGRSFEGTVTEVYSKIRNSFSGNKNALPNSASHFSRKLRSEYATFTAVGLTVNIDDTYTDGTHIKIIKRAAD